ncbi:Uncharacterised protein [Neisseria animaloris]|uniref:hypothetical protein n=1 Tax=Neisseria animaloris TaxID=326522 RepID=UPI000A18ECF9|nr:hypothetical protein [Neisseria animaloris]OSI06790.1 hypothetical protein BWD08_10525 [Neisseria animaloris]VEH86570.1 Uncharacterised protein [Neisseria animaloris]
MDISTDEYGLAIYGETGLNVLGANLLSPKLVGRLKLRQKQLGQLFVVTADGKELPSNDSSRNLSLDDLRGAGMENAYNTRQSTKPRDVEEIAEVRTEATHRYQFSLYGCSVSGAPLLPAVIHGWGGGFDRKKLEMAELLVKSVVSGVDLQMARALKAGQEHWRKNGYNGMGDALSMSAALDMQTGLPVTVTFRSTATAAGDRHGFGGVSVVGGLLYVEMTPFTEMDICFYETVGIPWEYFEKCSTLNHAPRFGIACYTFDPPTMKYAQPATDPAELFGKAQKFTGLNMGSIVRGEYFFAPNLNNTLVGLQAGLDAQDSSARRKLALFLEGDAVAELKYEKYSNAGLRLRLITNLDATKKGQQVSSRASGFPNGIVYTIRAGHDYAKVHSMLQHGCLTAGLSGGGVLNALGNVGAYSAFERSFANRPRNVRPPSIPDDYNGAPWNPGYTLRRSGLDHLPGMDYYTPILKQSPQAALGNPTLLDEINKFIYNKTWKIQRWFSIIFKMDDVVGTLPNANYSPEEAKRRQEALQEYRQELDTAEALAELNGTAAEAEYKRIQNELSQRLGLLELIDNVLDDTERRIADLLPFWGGMGHRHSNDKLELFNRQLGAPTGTPEYLPENWLMCRSPD